MNRRLARRTRSRNLTWDISNQNACSWLSTTFGALGRAIGWADPAPRVRRFPRCRSPSLKVQRDVQTHAICPGARPTGGGCHRPLCWLVQSCVPCELHGLTLLIRGSRPRGVSQSRPSSMTSEGFGSGQQGRTRRRQQAPCLVRFRALKLARPFDDRGAGLDLEPLGGLVVSSRLPRLVDHDLPRLVKQIATC